MSRHIKTADLAQTRTGTSRSSGDPLTAEIWRIDDVGWIITWSDGRPPDWFARLVDAQEVVRQSITGGAIIV